jgi:uncharacterized protein YwgA
LGEEWNSGLSPSRCERETRRYSKAATDMNSKELFEIHQEILSKLLSGEPIDVHLEKKIREFLLVANSKIDAYVHTVSMLSYELKKFNDLADELCSMRDLISTERNRKDELPESEKSPSKT